MSAVVPLVTPGLSGSESVSTPLPAAARKRVRVAVVAADELDDLLAPRVAAGDAHGAHRRLGARVDHAHQLDRRHGRADEARQLDLELRGRAVARARVDLCVQAADDLGMAPAEDHRAPRRHEVDVLVAVGVPDVRALARLMNSGWGMPTPFMARTGELTPPGMYWSASSNRRADVWSFKSGLQKRTTDGAIQCAYTTRFGALCSRFTSFPRRSGRDAAGAIGGRRWPGQREDS